MGLFDLLSPLLSEAIRQAEKPRTREDLPAPAPSAPPPVAKAA